MTILQDFLTRGGRAWEANNCVDFLAKRRFSYPLGLFILDEPS